MLKSLSVSSMDTAPSSSSCKNFVCFLEFSVKITQNFVRQSPWILLGSDTDGFPRLFFIWGHCPQLRLSSLLFHNCPLKNISRSIICHPFSLSKFSFQFSVFTRCYQCCVSSASSQTESQSLKVNPEVL